jgi:hypothetical protein
MSGIDSIEPCVHCPPSGRHWYEQGLNQTNLSLLTVLLTMPKITFNKTKRNSKYSKILTVRIKCKGNNLGCAVNFRFKRTEAKRKLKFFRFTAKNSSFFSLISHLSETYKSKAKLKRNKA